MENAPKRRYRSPFLRLKVMHEGKQKIGRIQQRFDELYRLLHQEIRLDKSPHLYQAREHLENACYRYCRACAEQHEESEG